MKRYLSLLALAVATIVPARALPILQLDVSGGVYDDATETTVSTSSSFTVYAMLNSLTPHSGNYFVSAALFPAPSLAGGNFGSFTVNGTTIHATADMTYGSPSQLPAHGIYPTWYEEFTFSFNSGTRFTNFNVQNVEGLHTGPVANVAGNALYVPFAVDVSGLTHGTSLVFDLYTYGAGGTSKVKFAPFSHNAGSGDYPSVPEGGSTLALTSAALIGLIAFRRRFARR